MGTQGAMAQADKARPLWRVLKDQGRGAEGILRYFQVRAPPVPVAKLAEQMGITLRWVDMPGWSGAVQSNPRHAYIWIASEDSPQRQRFTIAHELGHLMLQPVGSAFRDASFAGSADEIEANRFAADLLMPLWMLGPVAAGVRWDTRRLARMFEVSEAAMKIRLQALAGMR